VIPSLKGLIYKNFYNMANRSEFLVVCGAKTTKDDWFFSNFIGFSKSLIKLEASAKFLSCFPIGKFWEGNPKRTDIKFGRKEENNDFWKPMAIYTKFDYYNRERFWDQYDAEDEGVKLVDVSLQCIHDAAKQFVPGDSYTIILLAHGSDENGGSISIGGKPLRHHDLAIALQEFQTGVQVNLIVQSCYSGLMIQRHRKNRRIKDHKYVHTSATGAEGSFPNHIISSSGRLRGSPFSVAFLKCLDLAVDKDSAKWTLKGHEVYMSRAGKSYCNAQEKTAHPDMQTTNDLLSNFIDVLFSDFVCRHWSHPAVARRVITPLDLDTQIPPRQDEGLSEQDTHSAMESIEKELACMGTTVVCDYEAGLAGQLPDIQWGLRNGGWHPVYGTRIGSVLQGLRWRYLVQENYFLVMDALRMKGLIDIELSLATTVVNYNPPEFLYYYKSMLRCFPFVTAVEAIEPDGKCEFEGQFRMPTMWLAQILARSCNDIYHAFDIIAALQLFGTPDPTRLEKWKNEDIPVQKSKRIPNPGEGEMPSVAFWLPDALVNLDDVHRFRTSYLKRKADLKAEYEHCFGIGTWSSDNNMTVEQSIDSVLAEYEVRFGIEAESSGNPTD
jgi:hypothetical protein